MTVIPLFKIEVVPVADLRSHPLNWAEHDEFQLEAVQHLIEKYGWRQPLIVNKRTGFCIDGHGRITVAKAAGWTHVPVTYVDLDEPEELELLASYNQSARLAGTDEQQLANLLGRLQDHDVVPIGYPTGWVGDFLDRLPPDPLPEGMLLPVSFTLHPIEDDEDDEGEAAPPPEPRVAGGDLWQIGPHRLICGDCRDGTVIPRLLEGERVQGVFTSPPYAMQREGQYGGVPEAEYVEWWEAVQHELFLALTPAGSFFLNIKPHVDDGERSLYVFDLVLAMKRRWGWKFIEELCWRHKGYPTGNQYRFKNQFEPVYQFSRSSRPDCFPDSVRRKSLHATESVRRKFFPTAGDRKFQAGDVESATGSGFVNMDHFDLTDATMARPGNVVEVHASQLRKGHPAAFPVGLPLFFLHAYSEPGDVWLDPFAGAGTVALAAHQADREARLVEISPAYCDLILARLEEATGEAAVFLQRAEGL